MLGRQIEVLVIHNLIPDALSVYRETIRRNPSVILWEENGRVRFVDKTALPWVIIALLETVAQLCDSLLKLLGL